MEGAYDYFGFIVSCFYFLTGILFLSNRPMGCFIVADCYDQLVSLSKEFPNTPEY